MSDAMELKEAIKIVTEEIKNDHGYHMSWQANIAMAFYDEMARNSFPGDKETVHKVANQAAINFLNLLCKNAEPLNITPPNDDWSSNG